MSLIKTVSLTKPIDCHMHARDGEMLLNVINHTARQCQAAVIMPNLTPPVQTAYDVQKYLEEISDNNDCPNTFMPMMTAKLLESTTVADIKELKGNVVGMKYYPRGATTNSDDGIRNWRDVIPQISAMQDCGIPLLIHAENPHSFSLDREWDFVICELFSIVDAFPRLRIVVEHVSDRRVVNFIQQYNSPRLYATVTLHHLMMTLDDVVGGKLNSYNFCKPILKKHEDRIALRQAIFQCDRFMFGSDSAPHSQNDKQCCGNAGVYSAPVLTPLLFQFIYENFVDYLGYGQDSLVIYGHDDINRTIKAAGIFEDFTYHRACNFYGGLMPFLTKVKGHEPKIELINEPWVVPEFMPREPPLISHHGDNVYTKWKDSDYPRVWYAGETLQWRIKE